MLRKQLEAAWAERYLGVGVEETGWDYANLFVELDVLPYDGGDPYRMHKRWKLNWLEERVRELGGRPAEYVETRMDALREEREA